MNKVISIRTNPQSPTHAPNEEDASAAKKKSDADASSPPAPSETTGWVEPTDGAGSVLPGAADEDICIDEFGFCLTPEERAREKEFLRSVNQAQMSRRETKWEVMVQQWSQMIQRHPAKVKARARKGIHPKVRPTVWRLECGVGDVYNVQPSFQDYLEMGCDAVKAYIDRDLNRTFPTHVLFKETDSVGQVYLKNVLYAYAACDPEVGYCQGMGFVVATLLTQMEQEDAFWCLHHMMYNPKLQLRELYRPGFPLLNQFFYQLKGVMKIFLPGLADHFEKEGVDSAFYATQWFLTIFSYHFPFRVTMRVWDAFLHEGWKVVFRIGIALFSLHRVELMGLRFEELVTRLKTLCDGKNDEELMNASLKINLKTRQLEKLKEKYLEEKKSQPAPETK